MTPEEMLDPSLQADRLRPVAYRVRRETGSMPSVVVSDGDVVVATFNRHVEVCNVDGTFDVWVDGEPVRFSVSLDEAAALLQRDVG